MCRYPARAQYRISIRIYFSLALACVVIVSCLALMGCAPRNASEESASKSAPSSDETIAGQNNENRQSGTISPSGGDATVPLPKFEPHAKYLSPEEIQKRLFANVTPVPSEDPTELVANLLQIDEAIKDLFAAKGSQSISQQTFIEFAQRLGEMKATQGERLASIPTATDDQREAGLVAKLVALSQLAGESVRNVEAAKQLERFAKQHAQSELPQLAHQSRVVLASFELQALMNGQAKEPSKLISGLSELVQSPKGNGYAEFVILHQSFQALQRLGYRDAADEVRDLIVRQYKDATDPRLRSEAWSYETLDSPALEQFLAATSKQGPQFDAGEVFTAARGLWSAFPTIQTLDQLAGTIRSLEYQGHTDLTVQLADFLLASIPAEAEQTAEAKNIRALIDAHRKRTGILGQKLDFSLLIGFDEQPFDPSLYEGKVVLVDFWATWCGPCLQEIPNVREQYVQFHDQGFEVLAINTDRQVAQAKEFIQARKFPWANYRSTDPAHAGVRTAQNEPLEVESIPFMLIIGRDGTVKAMHVRGERLAEAIRAQL